MRCTITTDNKYILADIPYAGGAGPRKAKEIPGARAKYNDEEGGDGKFACWRYPLTMDTCRTFRRVFGDELSVLSPLSAWARKAVQIETQLDEIRSEQADVVFSRLPLEAPQLHDAINTRKYQTAGAGWLCGTGQGILGDEPGLGKTLQTLAALIECDAKVILVSCPRTAARNVWSRETNRWAPTIAPFVAQGSRAERQQVIQAFLDFPGTRKMLIINTEMMRAKRVEVCPLTEELANIKCLELGEREEGDDHKHKWVSEPEWPELHALKLDAFIIDEAHNALASTKNIQSKAITQVRYGAMMMRKCVKPAGLAIALSGTPARSRLTKLWGTLNWVRPDVWTSFWNFAGTHFGVAEGAYGMVIAEGTKVPKPIDEEQWARAIRPYMLQRDKKTAAPDLPEVLFTGTTPADDPEGPVGIWLDLDPAQRKAYDAMKRLAKVKLEGGTLTANGILAEITRARQFALSTGRIQHGYGDEESKFIATLPSNKIEWLQQFLLERDGYDSKILVASSFTSVLELLGCELAGSGYKSYSITGKTTDRRRAEQVAAFNDPDDPVKVFLINSRAGGEAITLDACCDDLVFLDTPWTSDEEDQVIGRIHRVSRIHQVMVHRLLSVNTVDNWMAANTTEQRGALLKARPDEILAVLGE